MGAPDQPEIWLIRGEGGDIIPMQLPLGEGIPARLRSGACVRVNPDGTAWTGDPVVAPDAPPASLAEQLAAQAEKDAEKPEQPLPRPAHSAKKSDWVAYVHSLGGITLAAAADLTKDELLARYGGA